MMLKFRTFALAVATGIACAPLVGVAVGAVAGSGASLAPGDAPAFRAGVPAGVPAALRARIESDAADFHLRFDQGRSVRAGRGGNRHWLVIPGRDGACLGFDDGDSICAPNDGVATGGLLQSVIPAPASPPFAREVVPGAGPGTLRGIAPAATTRVIAVDGAGATLASTEVVDGVYEVVVPDYRQFHDLEFSGPGGTAHAGLNQ